MGGRQPFGNNQDDDNTFMCPFCQAENTFNAEFCRRCSKSRAVMTSWGAPALAQTLPHKMDTQAKSSASEHGLRPGKSSRDEEGALTADNVQALRRPPGLTGEATLDMHRGASRGDEQSALFKSSRSSIPLEDDEGATGPPQKKQFIFAADDDVAAYLDTLEIEERVSVINKAVRNYSTLIQIPETKLQKQDTEIVAQVDELDHTRVVTPFVSGSVAGSSFEERIDHLEQDVQKLTSIVQHLMKTKRDV